MVKYQLLNNEGVVEKEITLNLKTQDKVIMTYDSDKFKLSHIDKLYKMVKESLENDQIVIPIPKGVELQVLSIEN